MSVHLAIEAVPAGALDWARANAPLPSVDVFFARDFKYRLLRGVTDFPLPADGPSWRSARRLYELLTGETQKDFWGTPATDRFKRALIGGDHYVVVVDEPEPIRFSTADEAAEAAITVREIARRGANDPAWDKLTWSETNALHSAIMKYQYFFDRYERGEELIYFQY